MTTDSRTRERIVWDDQGDSYSSESKKPRKVYKQANKNITKKSTIDIWQLNFIWYPKWDPGTEKWHRTHCFIYSLGQYKVWVSAIMCINTCSSLVTNVPHWCKMLTKVETRCGIYGNSLTGTHCTIFVTFLYIWNYSKIKNLFLLNGITIRDNMTLLLFYSRYYIKLKILYKFVQRNHLCKEISFWRNL